MSKKISIKDIAKLTNTSVTTVSYVINGKGRISKEIKEKILNVALENGYEPNRMAIGLRTGVSKVIGLIVESIGGQFFAEIAKVIEQEAEKAGYGIIYSSTNNSLQTGKNVIQMLSNRQVDGYIITPIKGLEEEIKALMNQKKPVVFIDSYLPGLQLPHVTVDNYTGVYEAIMELIRCGYRNIAFILPDLDLVQLHERLRGYQDALKVSRLKAERKHILKLPFNTEKKQMVLAITKFLKQNKQLDAVFFSTNYLGVAGLQSINDLKISIPKNLAVISFDDCELFELYPPGISAVAQPTDDIAMFAIQKLLSLLANRDEKNDNLSLKIPPVFIKRQSFLEKK
jgi:LacI family transcriptional regulator